MNSLNQFSALKRNELKGIYGGQLVPQSENNKEIPIISFGDPQDWDSNFATQNLF
ncbi:hypothetical protein [Aquimarina celericrescens]|uniref:Uncharacterized protein n=1 Tax=Aquimarina celericrescens TaxID=1964542 RepID=A0ABW5AXC6_9FLAO|nr:hypothetical protein [Aquimarina celericrescens]